MEQLNRDLLKPLYGCHVKNNINDKFAVLEYLNKIIKFLNQYAYEKDDDFIFLGRKKIYL